MCISPCLPYQVVSFNQTCLKSCPPILKLKEDSGIQTCVSECKAPLNFITIEGRCNSECVPPLVPSILEEGLYFCKSPCPPGKYVTLDFSCVDSCGSSNQVDVLFGIRFCSNPCFNGTIFNSLTGTCVNKCPNNTVLRIGLKLSYCEYLCKNGEYLFTNGTCGSECLDFWVQKGNNYKTCSLPCSDDEIYFPDNKTCLKNCTKSFRIAYANSIKYCKFYCKIPFVEFERQCVCKKGYRITENGENCELINQIISSKATLTIKNTLTSVSGVFLLGGSNSIILWGVVNLMQIFFYLVFMNVNYPESVSTFFALFDLKIIPNYLGILLGESHLEQPDEQNSLIENKKVYTKNSNDLYSPVKFYEHNYSGYFVSSAGDSLQILILSALGYIIYKILYIIVRNQTERRSIKKIMKFINYYFEWSLFLKTIFAGGTRLYIAGLLQISAIDTSSFKFAFSSILSGVIMTLMTCLLLITTYLIDKTKTDKTKYLKYRALIDDFKSESNCKYTISYILTQQLVSGIALVIFYEVPLVQNVILWANYLQMTMYYIFRWPHSDFLGNLDGLVFQIGLLIIHTFIFYFCSIDLKLIEKNEDLYENLGLTIIITALVILAIKALVMLISTLFQIKDWVKSLAHFILGARKSRKKIEKRGYAFKINERRWGISLNKRLKMIRH